LRFLFASFLICALTLSSSEANAAPDPALEGLLKTGAEALLKEVDKRSFPFETQILRVRMTMFGGADKGRQLEMTTHIKGLNKRAIAFHKPADLKGMRVVIKGRNDIKVRVPELNKVRKVASHARRQSFYGTDWSFDDMTMLQLSPDFSPKVLKQTEKDVILELTKKEGADLSYAKLTVYVDKATITAHKIEYFDDSGKIIREQVRSELTTMPAGHKAFKKVVMYDKTRDHKTIVDLLKDESNTDIPDSTFSRRWLVRGP